MEIDPYRKIEKEKKQKTKKLQQKRRKKREEKMTILLKAVWTQSTCYCIDEVR